MRQAILARHFRIPQQGQDTRQHQAYTLVARQLLGAGTGQPAVGQSAQLNGQFGAAPGDLARAVVQLAARNRHAGEGQPGLGARQPGRVVVAQVRQDVEAALLAGAEEFGHFRGPAVLHPLGEDAGEGRALQRVVDTAIQLGQRRLGRVECRQVGPGLALGFLFGLDFRHGADQQVHQLVFVVHVDCFFAHKHSLCRSMSGR
ncbi:hypothetical protein D3C75_661330 [compost metagenome]